jgi:hypothetical protein
MVRGTWGDETSERYFNRETENGHSEDLRIDGRIIVRVKIR